MPVEKVLMQRLSLEHIGFSLEREARSNVVRILGPDGRRFIGLILPVESALLDGWENLSCARLEARELVAYLDQLGREVRENTDNPDRLEYPSRFTDEQCKVLKETDDGDG